MVTVRPAAGGDFEKVYPLLLEFKNPYIRKSEWNRLFLDPWGESKGHFGTVMLDGEEAVGFLGLLSSKRSVRGAERRFCNLTSWIVREPYRGRSLFLLLPVLRERNATLVDLTPSAEVYALLRKAGFRDFETRQRILFPVLAHGPECAVTFGREALESALDPESLKIYRDHPFPGCRHALIESPEGRCYVVMNRMVRRKKPYFQAVIQHLSDRETFVKCAGRAVMKICLHLQVLALFADERLLGGARIPPSVTRTLNRPRVFRSDALTGEDLDGLYSESVLLNI
jgi:hypothetical protein